MAYATPDDVWKWLNRYTPIRGEAVGTLTTSTTTYDLDNRNVVSNSSFALKTGSAYVSSSAVPTASYSANYDEGQVTISSSVLSSGAGLYANYNHSDIPHTVMLDMISSSDRQIDRWCGRNWNSNSNQIDYYDVEEGNQSVFFTQYFPILNVDFVARNTADVTETPAWETLSAGLGSDYLTNSADLLVGKIIIIDNHPTTGAQKLKIGYDWGYASVPQDIKTLSILYTIRTILSNPTYAKSFMEGQDTFFPMDLDMLNAEIDRVMKGLRSYKIALA